MSRKIANRKPVSVDIAPKHTEDVSKHMHRYYSTERTLMGNSKSIIVNSASTHIKVIEGVERITVLGVIDPSTIPHIQVPDYQREILNSARTAGLYEAMKRGESIPPIDLGMRGDRTLDRNDRLHLRDDVFVIDGLQRTNAAKRLCREGLEPTLQATIHIDSDLQWERRRFRMLNMGQTGLSSNIVLRNLADDSDLVSPRILYRLATADRKFVLKGKVQWTQNRRKGDLISANTYYKVVSMLHSHMGAPRSSKTLELPTSLDLIVERIGENRFRANIRNFFMMLDDAFHYGNIVYKGNTSINKETFLKAWASVASSHENFWDGDKFFVPEQIMKRIVNFSPNDHEVVRLSGGGKHALRSLETLIVDELNRSARSHRLRKKEIDSPEDGHVEDDAEESEEAE